MNHPFEWVWMLCVLCLIVLWGFSLVTSYSDVCCVFVFKVDFCVVSDARIQCSRPFGQKKFLPTSNLKIHLACIAMAKWRSTKIHKTRKCDQERRGTYWICTVSHPGQLMNPCISTVSRTVVNVNSRGQFYRTDGASNCCLFLSRRSVARRTDGANHFLAVRCSRGWRAGHALVCSENSQISTSMTQNSVCGCKVSYQSAQRRLSA